VNRAQRSSRKAIHRKAVLAQRRKLEAQVSALELQVRQAATIPIRHCLIQQGLLDHGMGALILARGATLSGFSVGVFLLDTYCLGIKDVFFRVLDAEEFEALVDSNEQILPLVDINSCDARALLHDLAAWSRTIGFAPHRDFTAVEQLFGDVNIDDSNAEFKFGCDGKPLYAPGPSEPPNLVHARFAQLKRHLGAQMSELSPTDEIGEPAARESN